MDTAKERIYCLQTAFKLDPGNAAAKHGLILHGALPRMKPFSLSPVNRPRAWEEKLLLAHEKPKPKGWAAVKASPVVRLGRVCCAWRRAHRRSCIWVYPAERKSEFAPAHVYARPFANLYLDAHCPQCHRPAHSGRHTCAAF